MVYSKHDTAQAKAAHITSDSSAVRAFILANGKKYCISQCCRPPKKW
jgi:hypothetical protein